MSISDYTQHKPDCQGVHVPHSENPYTIPCSCGLDEALRRVEEMEEALRFWVARADRFEEWLPARKGYMRARGVLHESYAVGRAALAAQDEEGDS